MAKRTRWKYQYFHSMVKWRRKVNSIKGLKVNGNWVEDPVVVKKKNHYGILSNTFSKRPILDGVHFERLNEEDNIFLCQPFKDEEIKEAIWDYGSDKSPGSDGMNFHFIKKCCGTMKNEFVDMMKDFWANGVISRGANASFIVLLPKKDDLLGLEEYRPISLIGCLYKVISKVLAKRLGKVLGKIIDMRQSAFVGGRFMLDGVLLSNEVIDEDKRCKKDCLIFKVNFEKAYDSISWDFMYYMMGRLGFSEKWVRWIKWNIESTTISILVNGSPMDEFKAQKGL